MAQSNGYKEGSLIGGQGIQAEEPGAGLGTGASEPGGGGVDGQSIKEFEKVLSEQLDRLHWELKADLYHPQPVGEHLIPKAGQPGKYRALGIPTIYDRVCQQAVLNRLEGIFEPVFDEASFGYRRGRSSKDALRKVWRELHSGCEWIVDADLKDFFGSVNHEKLMALVAQRVADGRMLRLIESMLEAGRFTEGRQRLPTDRGTPQGGVISPLLSNILLTPFDWEMRRRGYQLTRYADDCAPRRRGKETEKWSPNQSLAAQGMRDGPSEPVGRDRLQTTVSCSGQEPG